MPSERKNLRPGSNLMKLGELISTVKQNLGLENNLKITALCEIWPLVTSFEIAKNSKPAYFDKDNNLVISIKSPSLTSELSMQKLTILEKLREATRNTDIRFKDIRFVNRSGS
jgi:hypothetical protein